MTDAPTQCHNDKCCGLTADRLRSLFEYDPRCGVFLRRIATGRHGRFRSGTVAGSIGKNGYIYISVDRKKHLAHRLAWLYVTGEWPKAAIDHIDGNPLNNMFSNLREATMSQNQYNKRMQKNNTSGVKGVYWSEQQRKWRAQIAVNYKVKALGSYDSINEAKAAHDAAMRELHGVFAREL
jgi:hypothetical protein